MAKLPKRTALDNYLLTKEAPFFMAYPLKQVQTFDKSEILEEIKEAKEKGRRLILNDPYLNNDQFRDYSGYLIGYKNTYDLIFNSLIDPIEKMELKTKVCFTLNEPLKYQEYPYKELITDLLEQIESEYLLYKQGLKNDTPESEKTVKTFFDFINNVKDKEAFAKDLKDTFNTEKGISFKIMIELLKAENILLIGNRDFAGFYRVINPFFNSGIGTYTALNDGYKHTADEQTQYAKEIQIIKQKLKPLITKHKG